MRRTLPVVVVLLLLALLLGGGWYWLGAPGRDALEAGTGLGGADAGAGGVPEELPPVPERSDGRLPPADVTTPSPPSPAGGDGGVGADASAEGVAPGAEVDVDVDVEVERTEDAARYTRTPRTFAAGDSNRRGPPTGQPVPVHELKLTFEDGSPIKGAEMKHRGTIVAKTEAQGYVRPLPRGPLDWFARSEWQWIGRRLWFKEQRGGRGGEGGGSWEQEMWSAGRQVSGVLSDRTGAPIPNATITLVHELEYRSAEWLAVTDAQGRWSVSDVTPSPLRVELSGDGLVRYAVPNWIAEGTPGATTEVTLQTARGRALEVEVKQLNGKRVYFGDVTFTYAWPELAQGRRTEWSLTAKTDRYGIASLLIADDIDLKVTAGGRDLRRRTVLGFGHRLPSKIGVTLRDAGRYSEPWVPVHCFDALTTRRLKPTVILARRPALQWEIGGDIAPRVVDARCHPPESADFPVLDLRDLDPGEWDFFLFEPGYAPVTLRAHASAGGMYPPYSVPMHPNGTPARFELADYDTGDPIPHAALGVRVPATQGPFVHELVFGGVYHGTAGVVSPPLPPGRYELRARASGFDDTVEPVTLTGHDQRVLKLKRLPGRR